MNSIIKPALYNTQLALSHPLCRNGKLRWLINEQTGTRLYDSMRQFKDGTILGATWSDGGIGLDGVDDYISALYVSGLSDWSVALTYTPETVDGIHPLIDQGNIVIYQDGRELAYGFRKAGGALIFNKAFAVFDIGLSIDIIVTKDGETYTAYRNGELLGSFVEPSYPDNSQSLLNVGRQISWTSLYCAGNEHASAGDTSLFNCGTDDISISMWIHRDGNPSTNEVLCEKYGDGVGYSFYLSVSGQLRGYFQDSGGTSHALGAFVCDGSWHHVAAVMDRSGEMQLYVDGIASGNAVDISARNLSINNTAYCHFGANSNGNQNFGGEMLDIKIYIATANCWEPENISYQASNAFDYSVSAGTLMDYWIGNDNSGTILSGKNNDLNLTSTNVWNYACGKIDDIAIWSRSLSPSAVRSYHKGKYCMISYVSNISMVLM